MLLDVAELTEHADNAIKNLVTQKVGTSEELYRFMVDQFNQSRAFFLELTVVIILVIELVYLFRGKPF